MRNDLPIIGLVYGGAGFNRFCAQFKTILFKLVLFSIPFVSVFLGLHKYYILVGQFESRQTQENLLLNREGIIFFYNQGFS